MPTDKQIAANKLNAEKSTGPVTEEGKQKSSLNAVKTGLTGRTVLLPGDDVEAYEEHVLNFQYRFNPVGAEEESLVQTLIDTRWRLDRCRTLEHGLFALGTIQFADLFEHEDPAVCRTLIQSHTFCVFQKEFRNLNIQEGRLQRFYDRTRTELAAVQTMRREEEAQEQLQQRKLQQQVASSSRSGVSAAAQADADDARRARLQMAADLYFKARLNEQPFDASQIGFEFSIAELEAYIMAKANRL